MPILDRMNQDNMPDDNGKGDEVDEPLFPRPAPVERKRPAIALLETNRGRGLISIGALVERIVDEFRGEHTPNDSAVRAASTRGKRLKLLLPVVDYVLSVESVDVDAEAKAQIMRVAYSDIFGFGPLDSLIEDESITTITLEGPERVSIRRGNGELEPIDTIFEDSAHMKDIVGRLLARANTVLLDNMPLMEVGFIAENGRFLSLSIAAPPITLHLSLDIRLHPEQPITLDVLVAQGFATPDAADVLRGIVQSKAGFMVVGQPESGKTTLLGALLQNLSNDDGCVAVERTGELGLSPGIERRGVEWPTGVNDDGVTFGEQIESLKGEPFHTVILDEVRADEPQTIASLLNSDADEKPRLIWSVRGTPDSKRLKAALGMLARRANPHAGESTVLGLFSRLPFVISVRRLNGELQLREIGEWCVQDDHVHYQVLVTRLDGNLVFTGERPDNVLPDLEQEFWVRHRN